MHPLPNISVKYSYVLSLQGLGQFFSLLVEMHDHMQEPDQCLR